MSWPLRLGTSDQLHRHLSWCATQLASQLGHLLASGAAWDAAALLLHKCAAALPMRGATSTELDAVAVEIAEAVDTPDLPVKYPQLPCLACIQSRPNCASLKHACCQVRTRQALAAIQGLALPSAALVASAVCTAAAQGSVSGGAGGPAEMPPSCGARSVSFTLEF